MDESFGPIQSTAEGTLEQADAAREVNRNTFYPCIFDQMSALTQEIESLRWTAFDLNKAGESARAENIRGVIAQKQTELKALVAERRKSL